LALEKNILPPPLTTPSEEKVRRRGDILAPPQLRMAARTMVLPPVSTLPVCRWLGSANTPAPFK
jgi:hypothetical protein